MSEDLPAADPPSLSVAHDGVFVRHAAAAAIGADADSLGPALHAVVSRIGENDVRHVVPDRVELAERVRSRRDCLNPVYRLQPGAKEQRMPPAGARPRRADTPRKPRRADAARNRQLLVDAAGQLIDEGGPALVMDEVARRAGVANATLYRNFPARSDLLVAVYAGDVDDLCDQGTALLRETSPGTALFTWMDSFVRHVAARRPLALAATEGSEQRGELFSRWHERMASTAAPLLTRAQDAGAVRGDLTARDILALANAAAIAGTGPDDARRLLDVMRLGFAARAGE